MFNIVIIPQVSAEAEILEGNYKFIDTCYSPELGVYVAVAKDLEGSAHPAQILASADGAEWQVVRKITNGIHDANKPNRQTVVWWEAQHCFVAAMSKNILTSKDGFTWDLLPSTVYSRSNNTLTTNGKLLVIASMATVRIFESFDEEPLVYNIDSNAFGMNIGVTDEEPYVYATMTQWMTWEFCDDGRTERFPYTLGGSPFEMVYVSSFDGWILLDGTKILKVLSKDAAKYTSFSSMHLSNGMTNDEKYTAAGASDSYVAVGTETGKIYIAPNDSEALTVNIAWDIAVAGNGIEDNTETVCSISAVDENTFFAVTEKKIFMVMKSEDGWKYYDTSKSDIVLENERIEIPSDGSKTLTLSPVHYDFRGEISSDEVVSFTHTGEDVPAGVTLSQKDDTSVEITVDSSLSAGYEIPFEAVTASGKKKDLRVTLAGESYVSISGLDEMPIPLSGKNADTYKYTAAVIGTDEKEMTSCEAVMELVSMPQGAKYDSETGTFTIDDSVQSGVAVLRAYSKNNPDNFKVKKISISPRRADKVEFGEGEAKLLIPDSNTADSVYSAVVYDQTGTQIPDGEVLWSVEAKDIESMDGISINEEGVLSIDSTAKQGTITITIAAADNNTVTAQRDVILGYTNLRMAKEDLALINVDDTVPVTDSLTFIAKGEAFASDITWESSDETVVKTDGTVIRPSREDKQVTITIVAKNNGFSTNKKYTVTVKKNDNLCVNGDLADGTYNGWNSVEDTVMSIETDGENNVLKASGKGVYQKLTFSNDSSYAFEAKVKAASGTKIRLVSKIAGTLAEIISDGSYKEFKTSYDYRKQKNSFEDELYLYCDGDIIVDYLKSYEITKELSEVSAAVNKAVYSKNSSDKAAAQALLDLFYNLPIKAELQDKLDKIETSSGNGSSSGGGGGGGGGGGTTPQKPNNVPPSKETGIEDTVTIVPPVREEDNYKDQLDTYLLKFKDMKNHWAREDVEYMGEKEIISGYENGMFYPDNNISRAEFAVLITRTMGLEGTKYENSFFDVVSDDWYSGYVQTVRANGYMTGYDGLFNPYKPISREEIAKTIISAYNAKTNTKLEMGKSMYFNDLDDISSWAYDYLAEAVELGFVNGATEEILAPKELATRAQAAVMLRRVYDKLNGSGEEK